MFQQYSLRLEKIEAVLRTWLPESPDAGWNERVFSLSPESPPDIAPLVKSLSLPDYDLVNRGGKRWRPLLMTLVCEALGGGERALPLTPLVEFSHNASLIHDDIEDDSVERRGEPAVHTRYGLDTAINSGSFLYFLPLACVTAWDAPPELKNTVYRIWGEHIRRLHLGQAMDIAWHRDPALLPGLEEYDLMCRLKTGSLASLAAVLGVVAAQEPKFQEKESSLIRNLGLSAEKLGMGFQIMDDVKNLTTGNAGKQRGDDVVEGKKSLPVLLYLRKKPERREWLGRCFAAARENGINAPQVEEVIAELSASTVLDEAVVRARAFTADARNVFATIPARSDKTREELTGFLQLMGEIYG
jgi:octaprenyl-diphosphate synthase